MDSKRKADLDRWYGAVNSGQTAPSGVKPPTQDEAIQYGQTAKPVSNVMRQNTNPTSATPDQSGLTRGTIKPVNSGRAGYPNDSAGATSTPAPSSGRAGYPNESAGGTGTSTTGTSTTGTSTTGTGTTGTSGTSSSGGSRGSTRGSGTMTAPSATPRSARSLWSEVLHGAMEEAGGDPRALRLPFEQHPAQVFDRYQQVAQPGYGRPVASTMPGQGPPQQGSSFPGGQFPGGMPAMDRAQQTYGNAMEQASPYFQRSTPAYGPATQTPMPAPGSPGGPMLMNGPRPGSPGGPMLNVGPQQPHFSAPAMTARPMQPVIQPVSRPTYSPPRTYGPPQGYSPEPDVDEMIARTRYQAGGSY